MVEDYQIQIRTGRAEGTGFYEITRRGNRREITKYKEKYKTPAGVFTPEEWKKKALAAIEKEGEMELLGRIKEYCRKHCAWLHEEKEIEEHAINCLCGRVYKHWKDFKALKNHTDIGGKTWNMHR